MESYRIDLFIAPSLPDGRLAEVVLRECGPALLLLEGYIQRPAVRDIQEFARHFRPLLDYRPDLLGEPADYETVWEPVPDRIMHRRPFACLPSRDHYTAMIHADLVRPELCREVTGIAQEFGGVLPYRRAAKGPCAASDSWL